MWRRIGILGFVAIALFLTGLSTGGTDAARASTSSKPSTTVRPAVPAATATPPACTAGWSVVTSPSVDGADNRLVSAAAVAPSDVWAVGNFMYLPSGPGGPLLEHWDGLQWSAVVTPSIGQFSLGGISALGADDIWAVGADMTGTLTLHWDGTQWRYVPSPNGPNRQNDLAAVSARAADDVWAVGRSSGDLSDRTLIQHWNGSIWTVVPSPSPGASSNELEAVVAVTADDVWAAGFTSNNSNVFRTLIEHWDGSSWSTIPSPSPGSLSQIAGLAASSAGDVWAVGTDGYHMLILHWDGSVWTQADSPSPYTSYNLLRAIAIAGPNDIWAAGYGNDGSGDVALTEHWDGTQWTALPVPHVGAYGNYLFGIAATESREAWVVGDYSADNGYWPTLIEHYTNPCATASPTPSPTAAACTVHFSDVQPSDYFYLPVQHLACAGVIAGYADGTFRPYANTTRAQMVKIVVLGFGLPIVTPAPGEYVFADVLPSNPFFAVVETAAHAGLVGGYTCGEPGEPCDDHNRPYFHPYADVNRGQLAKIAVLGAGWALQNPPVGTFADVVPGSPFYNYIETAICHGIISGYDCGGPGEPCDPNNRPYFRPYHSATRGQIAKIVDMALGAPPGCAVPRP